MIIPFMLDKHLVAIEEYGKTEGVTNGTTESTIGDLL